MKTRHRCVGSVLSLAMVMVVLAGSDVASSGQSPQTTTPDRGTIAPPAIEVIVPVGAGAPVITDGTFSPGEWDDATRFSLGAGVQWYLKQYRDVVFIGLRGPARSSLGTTEISLAVPGGPITTLHVSAQLGEIVLPATGDAPPFRGGFTLDWYANEQRNDEPEAQRLMKEGKSRVEAFEATVYPYEGIEFAIRRSKFPGTRWLMRVRTSGLLEGGEWATLVHPPASPERTTDGWQVLIFD